MSMVRGIRCTVSGLYIEGIHTVTVGKIILCNIIAEIITQLSKCLVETEITRRDSIPLIMVKGRRKGVDSVVIY